VTVKRAKQTVLPIIIFALLCVLRFWKAADWFSFNFDEEYQALISWSQVKDFHPIWIGVSASNFGFYLGPGFTYLNALLFWISKGDLSILAYFSSLFGLITTLSLYHVSSKIFSKKVGIVSSLIYGFSALLIYFDHRFWNPTPIMFITIWLLFSLYQAKNDSRWYILTSILMATALHVHLSLAVYWPLILYLLIRSFRKISIKTWFVAIVSYALVVLPLIIFDINHNFDNILGPLKFLAGSNNSDSSFSFHKLFTHARNIFSSTSRLIFLNFYTNIQEEHGLGAHGAFMTRPNTFLSLFSFIAFVSFFVRSKANKNLRILGGMIISIVAFYVLYPQWGAEYYLLSFFILFTIVLALFLEHLSWKALAPLLVVYAAINSITIFTTTQSPYGLVARRDLVDQVMVKIEDRPFSLETEGKDPRKYHPYGGWHYLFQTYGNRPTLSFADEFFGWTYPDEISTEKPLYRVIIAEQKNIPCTADQNCKPVHSGAFTAYIFNLQ